MFQLTHLGRLTYWNVRNWLPVVSSGHEREPAHRAYPKLLEDWDMDRIAKDCGDAAERMQAAGLDDGFELGCGYLLDSF